MALGRLLVLCGDVTVTLTSLVCVKERTGGLWLIRAVLPSIRSMIAIEAPKTNPRMAADIRMW